ncbi:MAG TPA: sensor histidine kinase [Candidatus Sulfotelmatobacter sp.]
MPPSNSLFARTVTGWVARYTVALSSLAIALGLGRVLSPFCGNLAPYALSFMALVLSSLYCGVGPSVAATILDLSGLKFWFIAPTHTFQLLTLKSALEMATVLLVSAGVIAMGEIRHREYEALRRKQGNLEDRVQHRTAELEKANQSLRELTARLMQLQDEERRRIARELHDSVGQILAALTMNLTTVSADIEKLVQTGKIVSDSLALAQEMHKEVRTVSYLLHPPLLDESGLASALRWYVEGFSERSKIKVQLEIPDEFGRLPQEMETAIFRTVQECLTNIHHHSGSAVAAIRITRSADEIRLNVEDRGTGIPSDKLQEVMSAATPGVGVRGMRERMRQLGGSLELRSNASGTSVEAWLPTPSSVLATSEVAA